MQSSFFRDAECDCGASLLSVSLSPLAFFEVLRGTNW